MMRELNIKNITCDNKKCELMSWQWCRYNFLHRFALKGKVKIKFFIQQAMKAQEGE